MGDDVNTEVVDEEQKEQDEYNEGWDKLAEAEEKGEAPKASDENKGLSDEVDKAPSTPDPVKAEPTVDELKAKLAASDAALATEQKRVRDNQAYATRTTEESKRLQSVIDQHEKGKATDEDLDKSLADLKKASELVDEDYPDMDPIFKPIIERSKALEAQVKALLAENATDKQNRLAADEQSRKQADNIADYRANVLPAVLGVHSDFVDVIKTPQFNAWVKEQSESTQHSYYKSRDSRDAINLMTEYKKYLGSDEAIAALKEQETQQKTTDAVSQSLRGGGGGGAPFKGKEEEESYDAGWDRLAAIEAKKDK